MCGFAGIIRRAGVSDADVQWGAGAAVSLAHRGPDRQASVVSTDQRAVFAHARLSIIDLSEQGNQPMASTDGRRLLVFNGEIYNYASVREELQSHGRSFRTHSDTEVILQALDEWGPKACDRLEGMFAFALHDATDGSVILGRDRAGQKPLYRVELEDGGLAFASELRTLLTLPRQWRLSRRAVVDYLRFGYTWQEQSVVSGVHRVAPATVEKWLDGRCTTTTYWTLPNPSDADEVPGPQLLDRLEETLQLAVERTLVSDVPVGVLLSGGVDSSLVAAMAARSQPGIRAFTVSFPGHSMDEGSQAAVVASKLGLPHELIVGSELGPAQVIEAILDQDEPIADPSILPMTLLCRSVSQYVRVALGGDGGDELFGGYVHYQHLQRLADTAGSRRDAAQRWAASSALKLAPIGVRGKYQLERAARHPRQVSPPLGSVFQRCQVMRLLNAGASTGTYVELSEDPTRVVDATMRMDFTHYLPNDILHKVDRAAMRCSLEVRSPMLDSDLVEYAFSGVPLSAKVGVGGSKLILKRLRERVLGEADSLGRKQGFSPPLATLLAQPGIRQFVVHTLDQAPAATWNVQEVRRWSRSLLRGGRAAHQVFSLACLIAWQQGQGIYELADD